MTFICSNELLMTLYTAGNLHTYTYARMHKEYTKSIRIGYAGFFCSVLMHMCKFIPYYDSRSDSELRQTILLHAYGSIGLLSN